jgi:peptidoglycan/xylan/chitin deacetylase (PgdA/CDA1 family)
MWCHVLWRCLAFMLTAGVVTSVQAGSCRAGKLYLTLDTGNMKHAEFIAQTLKERKLKATFFVANEKTPRGDYALEPGWDGYWRDRVSEGHAFGNHTFDHVYFKGQQGTDARTMRATVRPQFGASANKTISWDGSAICQELDRVRQRFLAVTGKVLDPIWRAPGGKAPDFVMTTARQCGYRHFYWAQAGFLGDELPSDRYPNRLLVDRALANLRDGDVIMAHLGIWSRQEPFALMLPELLDGLLKRGFCFATLREHPDFPSQAGKPAHQ